MTGRHRAVGGHASVRPLTYDEWCERTPTLRRTDACGPASTDACGLPATGGTDACAPGTASADLPLTPDRDQDGTRRGLGGYLE